MVSFYNDGMWQNFYLWLPMGGKVYDNVVMYDSNSQLTSWVGEMEQFMWEKKISKWSNIIM